MSKRALVLTHRWPKETACAFEPLFAAAAKADFELLFDASETEKHALSARDGVVVDADTSEQVDVCIVLGGDGTILSALRRFAHTGVPVFAVNFGEVGFLATIEPEGMERDFARAFAGEFEVLSLPAVVISGPDGRASAINDISIHRKVGERVAELSYLIEGEEVGSVRCDGVVVSTPAGSTGYNLANGGPVLAWGVEGYGVSFIAPHSFNARALVCAPHDVLHVHNRSEEQVDISIDGRPAGHIDPHEEVHARFLREATVLAQLPDSSFYRRLREKFGRLSS